jgi:hypothetical protein
MVLFIIGILLVVAGIVIYAGAPMNRLVKLAIAASLGLVGFVFVFTSTVALVPDGTSGVVIKKFGPNLPQGQIVARNGEQGPQAALLGPGWHFWFWPWVYTIEPVDIYEVQRGQVGVVVALDGKPLLDGEIFAKEFSSIDDMIDGEKFLASGFKGPQLTVLGPGQYRINPRLFNVSNHPALEVDMGEVAVIKANAGQMPTEKDINVLVNGLPLVPK